MVPQVIGKCHMRNRLSLGNNVIDVDVSMNLEYVITGVSNLEISKRENDDIPAEKDQNPLAPGPQHAPGKSAGLISPPITPPRTSGTSHRRVSIPLPSAPPSSIPGAWPSSPTSLSSAPQSPSTPCRPTGSQQAESYPTPQSPRIGPSSRATGASNPRCSPQMRAASESPTRKGKISCAPGQCTAHIKGDGGRRCSRNAVEHAVLSCRTPDASHGGFCRQHLIIFLKGDTDFLSRAHSVDTWVTFADWIPGYRYLSPEVQARLRMEMVKPVSNADEPGYVYAYQIRKPGSNDFAIKIGRSTQVAKRIDDWAEQCPSEKITLRGWWPGNIDKSVNPENRWMCLQRGAIEPGPMGKYCHLLEKLVHMELADVAFNSLHLMPEFTEEPSGENTKDYKSSSPKKSPPAAKRDKKPCPDCKQVHREKFQLERDPSGKTTGREWEEIVKPIIERWGKFVTQYAYKHSC